MGDPKKIRRKYSTPLIPWNKNNIEVERKLKQEYALKNKKEILIASSFLKKYKNIAKKLIATRTKQAEKEKGQVLKKLFEHGLIPAGVNLDQILAVELKDILERRAQSLVFRKGLSKTMNQARQFIVHHHIIVGEKEITSPSTLLTTAEEQVLRFKESSSLADENHPERMIMEIPAKTKEETEIIRKKNQIKAETEEIIEPEENIE